MANLLNGFLDNFLSAAGNPKGNLGDYAHASRLYVDSAFRLAPKTKFLYHVVFELSATGKAKIPQLSGRHINEINLLVKSVDLPKFEINTVTKNMYNRKKNLQTNIEYDPVNVTFHDDNLGVTTLLLEAYYRYYYKDGNHYTDGISAPYASRNTYGGSAAHNYRFGLDNSSRVPFFNKITIYQLSRHEYTGFTLVNPLLTGMSHDTMDQSDASGTAQNQITVAYESVFYSRGRVSEGLPTGFASDHYDKTPSPLGIQGGGTESIFGQGGVLTGISSVLNDVASGEANLGTLISAANTFKNAKNLTSEGIRQEGLSVITGAINQAAKSALGGVANTNFPKNTGSANKLTDSSGGVVDQTDPNYATRIAKALAAQGL